MRYQHALLSCPNFKIHGTKIRNKDQLRIKCTPAQLEYVYDVQDQLKLFVSTINTSTTTLYNKG